MAYHQPYDPYYLYHAPPPPAHLHLQPQPQPHVADEPGAINTIFISGLPDDVKPREIHNLFRNRLGFESCQLKYTGRGNQVVAFATFCNHQSAIAAVQALNGVKFDPQTGSTLHIELARTNSRRKHRSGTGPYVIIDNRTKTLSSPQEVSSDDGATDADEGHESSDADLLSKADAVDSVAGFCPDGAAVPAMEHPEKNYDGGVAGQPCSTLFIANLGPNCTDDELKQALSHYPGFNTLKLRARGGMPVAFADFEEVEQATTVMVDLQGRLLPSSDRGGMHIEYARSKMRKN